jgi:hypothetical protein
VKISEYQSFIYFTFSLSFIKACFKIITQREKENLPYIEYAVRYVILLFLASQKERISERIELLNLSSRRYLLLRETEKISEASLSSFVSGLARTLIEKTYYQQFSLL